MSSTTSLDALRLYIEQAKGIRSTARKNLTALVEVLRREFEGEQRRRYNRISARIHRERMTVK
jgi:hypothetical protein